MLYHILAEHRIFLILQEILRIRHFTFVVCKLQNDFGMGWQ
jgi:hypothetical protein